jgi:penicillin-binding protein 2
MRDDVRLVSDLSALATGALFIVGLVVLGFRLAQVQLVDAAKYLEDGSRQAARTVQTAGPRGRILARDGTVLADNRASVSIVVNPEGFQRRNWSETVAAISNAIDAVSSVIGLPPPLTTNAIARHVRQQLARPLVVWRDVGDEPIALFSEHERDFPGFECVETEERTYPEGRLAAHVIGYVGRAETEGPSGEKFNFRDKEMKGRAGLEAFYDGYLRGSSGEIVVTVDARGFAVSEQVVGEARRGPDLNLTIDPKIQRSVERQLRGEYGACAVLDPRDGAVLALASAPAYDLNLLVPRLTEEMNARYVGNHACRNRACFETYAPGSTFKPITALAGLRAGRSSTAEYECTGLFELAGMRLHCARRWGHGPIDMRHALKESCNTYFCNLGSEIGTNALFAAARDFGLGEKTGIDFPQDSAGIVPSAEFKRRNYNLPWYAGDLAQASIGQGQLLVTPLQMARVAGAIGTGRLVRPHLRADAPVETSELPFAARALAVVREGMRMVVDGGTGKLAGEGVAVPVAGKTGTAEVGRGATRRKNTWFIAYAPAENPTVAIAMVIENGVSGGGTTAPRVCEVLKTIFGEK